LVNIRRIFDFRDLDLNSSSDDQTLFIRANNKNYSLSELGSGFTQFFLMFLSAAIRDPKPKFILIDEPELNLHPSLQLDFLTALGSYASEGLLFATHNYGLARAASERIYLVRKTPEGESIVEPNDGTTHLSTFLGELGFSAYHDLGFDKILLVEGPSELKTIQQFLRLYQKDHKFVLIHLGGGSSIHGGIGDQLEEMKRITPNISVVIDSEKANPNAILEKRIMEFENACKIAGVSCMILKRRAMENYFPDASIRKALGEHYKQLGHYEKLSEAKTPWNKNFNWRIAREMDIKDLEGTDLGEFLNSL